MLFIKINNFVSFSLYGSNNWFLIITSKQVFKLFKYYLNIYLKITILKIIFFVIGLIEIYRNHSF